MGFRAGSRRRLLPRGHQEGGSQWKTGVSEGAYRAGAVEAALAGQVFSEDAVAAAAASATEGADPLEDPFADADYRRQLANTMAKRAIIAAWNNA